MGTMRRHLDHRPPELAALAATGLLVGMTNLCGLLLAMYEAESGASPEETLAHACPALRARLRAPPSCRRAPPRRLDSPELGPPESDRCGRGPLRTERGLELDG